MVKFNSYIADSDEREFRKFDETHKIVTFALACSHSFPNTNISKLRLLFLVLECLASTIPFAVIMGFDVWAYWKSRDKFEIIRHGTIGAPFFLGFLKRFIMYSKRVEGRQIVEMFNRDYAEYNKRSEEQKLVIREYLKGNLIYTERYWAIAVFVSVLIFPLAATIQNLYENLSHLDSRKYMIHDINKPLSPPEERFSSPFFEFMYGYLIYCSVICMLNFIGYDGFFGLITKHGCLKMKLFCMDMAEAMREDLETEERRKMVVNVIKAQNDVYELVNLIQETFNIWLGFILVGTMIQICIVMYYITEGQEFDLRYAIFIFGSVVHIFLPCYYCSKLQSMSSDTADMLYCSGWETVYDESTRRKLVFMIARAQIPVQIIAFNLKTFDMSLFVSIIQTSYSMLTLLKS